MTSTTAPTAPSRRPLVAGLLGTALTVVGVPVAWAAWVLSVWGGAAAEQDGGSAVPVMVVLLAVSSAACAAGPAAVAAVLRSRGWWQAAAVAAALPWLAMGMLLTPG